MLTSVRERLRRPFHRSAPGPRTRTGRERCHELVALDDDAGNTGSHTLAPIPDVLLPFAGADTMSTTALFGRAQSVAARWSLADVEEVLPSLERGIVDGRGGRLAFRLAVELARGGRLDEAAAIARGAATAVDTVCRRARAAAGRGRSGRLERAVTPAAALLPALGAVPELCDAEREGPIAAALAPLMDAVVELVHLLPIFAGTQEGARVIAGEVRRAGRGQPSGLRLALRAVDKRRRPALAAALVEGVGRFAAGELRRSRSARAANSLLGLAAFADTFDDDPARLARAGEALVQIGCGPSVAHGAGRLRDLLVGTGGPTRGLLALGVLLSATRARASGDSTELHVAVVALAPDDEFPTELLERMSRSPSVRFEEARAEAVDDDDPTARDLPAFLLPGS